MNQEQMQLTGDENISSVSGLVEAIVYQNDENGYTVCSIEATSGEVITAVGILPYVQEGDKITARGGWI